ncbi:hypothetical protein PFMALIP_03525 [Plasmodium falciparum MaliPS096_E11]|uniref:Plasmodium RESA N-terminal domain-containing protein n=2 Tax=Plasmodium falciparum TaxID=5833 RepID=A0A024WP20_PLAFA|nr:hypothetical protein PFFVO_03240 [Plasmodium falciparum Vietnam Oak-Knoll (FVO)]ETW48440.1 hypothetical protein PFMALIP_03525 [Plasmodium falciparum MaliPS096_E11]
MIFTNFKILSIEILVFLLLLLHIDKPKNVNLVKTDIYNGFVQENARYLAEQYINKKMDQTLQHRAQLRTAQNETCNGSEKLMRLKYISYLITYMDITYKQKEKLLDLVEQYIYSNIEHEKKKLSKFIDPYINKEDDEKSKINFQNILYEKKRIESLKYSELDLFLYTIFPYM